MVFRIDDLTSEEENVGSEVVVILVGLESQLATQNTKGGEVAGPSAVVGCDDKVVLSDIVSGESLLEVVQSCKIRNLKKQLFKLAACVLIVN